MSASSERKEEMKELAIPNPPFAKVTFNVAEGPTDEVEKAKVAVMEYMKQFAEPSHCPGCGGEFKGGLLGLIGGPGVVGFEWGLAHGEGHCTVCGYPMRGYHRIGVGQDEPFCLEAVLPYHPSVLRHERK